MNRIRLAVFAISLGMAISPAFADVVSSTTVNPNLDTTQLQDTIQADVFNWSGGGKPGFDTAPPDNYPDFYSNNWGPGWYDGPPPYGRHYPEPVPEPGYGFLLAGGLVAAVLIRYRRSAKHA